MDLTIIVHGGEEKMARLIDADALIPSEVHTVVVLKEGGTEVLESVLYAEQIDYAPTVDAEPVVRCKDCVHWKEKVWLQGFRNCCESFDWFSKDSDYCSFAKRREDETD